LLHKTIRSILDNFTGNYEVVPVIDGYKLREPIVCDEHVRPIVHDRNKGMRESINTGVRESRGEHIMRTDEHCMFCKGFDEGILNCIEDDEIATGSRHVLDPKKWELVSAHPVNYEKLIVQRLRQGWKFAAQKWRSRDRERKDLMVDETMAMQGSVWVMSRSWWDRVIGRLDSRGYGTLYQDSVEMVFKTWRAGGRLMLNKHVWYAHKGRKFHRTHNYPNSWARASFTHSLLQWLPDYMQLMGKWGLHNRFGKTARVCDVLGVPWNCYSMKNKHE